MKPISAEIECSIQGLMERHPDKIFEGEIISFEDPENNIEMKLDPIPNACAVCAAVPVVFRVGAIIRTVAFGFCENHKSAFCMRSKEIDGKVYNWFIY